MPSAPGWIRGEDAPFLVVEGPMMPITLLDGILIVIMLISALLAMIRGFVREVLSVVSWVLAAVAAFYLYKPLLPYVEPYIANHNIAIIATALRHGAATSEYDCENPAQINAAYGRKYRMPPQSFPVISLKKRMLLRPALAE